MSSLPAKGERMNLDAENYQRMMDKAEVEAHASSIKALENLKKDNVNKG